ncbi:MAG: YidB family protein, partial [Methylococcaceae bacterium]
MPLFSEIVRDSAENLGLGNKAAALVAAASRAVFDPGNGGLRGFLARCDKAGLTELTRSWHDSSEPPKPLSGAQLESILGRDVVTQAGRELGMANARVRTAMAFVVPQLVRVFSRDGEAPTDIPPALEMFLNSANARRTAPTSRRVARNHTPAPVSRLWALGVVVLMVSASWLGYDLWHEQSASGRSGPQQAPAVAIPPNAQITSPLVGLVPERVVSRSAWLSIRNNNGQFVYSGVVADIQTQSALVNRMKAVWGDRQSGSLILDPAVGAAGWLPAFDRLLPQLDIRGLDVRLDGNTVKVGGWLP